MLPHRIMMIYHSFSIFMNFENIPMSYVVATWPITDYLHMQIFCYDILSFPDKKSSYRITLLDLQWPLVTRWRRTQLL